MSISLLSTGDVFDPLDLSFNIHSSKQPIVNENLTFDGNFLITDIGSGYAVSNALISGLAENTQSVQEGVVLKFHDHTSHGYRYEFRKTTKTKSFHADSLDGSLYSVLDVQLGISPIANGLFPSETQKPIDVQDLPMATKDAISSIAFRGILTTNPRLEFRPTDFVTRREFALACVRCVHLNAPSDEPISSIESIDVASIELRKAIEAGFIELDSLGQLRPDRPVSDRDLKRGLTRLVKRCVEVPSPAFQSALARIQEADHATISRGHFALMLSQLLFPASHPSEKGD